MTTPAEREPVPEVPCPVCKQNMRREFDGVRQPPMPSVFWFCTNAQCDDGKRNHLYQGG